MISTSEVDLLFDDVSVLATLTGKNALNYSSPSNDCDCIGYSSTSTNDDNDTDQIPASPAKANR